MTTSVGIDIGNDNCVIATSSNGIANAILNEESRRETPTVVHFAKNQRLFGGVAATKLNGYPSSTISQLKRLVGRRSDEPGIVDELHQYHFPTSFDANGNVLVEVDYLNKQHLFTPTQMLGMLLSYLNRTAKTAVGQAASGCVIGVPAYFSPEQKTAYLNAARIGGWNALGLLDEGAATALAYGVDRTDGAAASCVVFVDIGHSDTQVTVVRFEGKHQTILATEYDANLGGRDFDGVIFEYFVTKLKMEKGINVRASEKATVKLKTACEKAKRVLSANTEAQIGIESLMDDIDVKDEITRVEFERMSSDLLHRIGQVFENALACARLAPDQVHSVELVGSGSRIPAISTRLTVMFGREMSRTINGSECIARGCALLCEMLDNNRRFPDSEAEKHTRLGFFKGAFTSGRDAKDDLSVLQKNEEWLEMQDRNRELADQHRNELESYFYRASKELYSKYPSSTREYVEIQTMLTETGEWLDRDETNEPYEVYRSKLHELMTRIASIESGHNEGVSMGEKKTLYPWHLLEELRQMDWGTRNWMTYEMPALILPPTRSGQQRISPQCSSPMERGPQSISPTRRGLQCIPPGMRGPQSISPTRRGPQWIPPTSRGLQSISPTRRGPQRISPQRNG